MNKTDDATEEMPNEAAEVVDDGGAPSEDASAEAQTAADDATGETAEAVELDVDELKALLVAAQTDAETERDNALRAAAEMENLRRRATRDVENAHKFGLERLINELLPVIDSLELGLQAGEQEAATLESLREGGELTLKLFRTALEKFEALEVNPLDATFDPEFHQAMSMQEVEGTPPGTILQVVQKGYTLHGRLVRPAMVIVAK
ncbi:MAG: nucleotide exchange factor GrpE [Pseudomonadota bacterium]